jgi:hypothetical protein
MVLFTWNNYNDTTTSHPTPPERLTSGPIGRDPDFWCDSIRGWQPPSAVEWLHGSAPYNVVRAARVPYCVKGGNMTPPRLYLDHLLMGITEIDTAGGTVSSPLTWTIASDMAPNRHLLHLGLLGRVIINDLWMGPGTAGRVTGWQVSTPAPEGFSKVDAAPNQDGQFRELTIKPDSTVRVTLVDAAGNRRFLLVGYEGGGAW